jgi:hypothetical protein
MARPEAGLPGWVERANQRLARCRPTPTADHRSPPQVGEIRLAVPPASLGLDRRLVCVVEVDRCERAARVVLLSNEIEMASELDLVIPGPACGFSFDLLAEVRVAGWLWWARLGPGLGRLNAHWTDAVKGTAHGAAAPTRAGASPAEGSPGAAIEKFHRIEAARLRALAAPCEAARDTALGDLPLVVDPKLLEERRGETASLRARRLVDVAGELAGRATALVPGESIREVLDVLESGPHQKPDLAAAVRPLLEGALAGLAVEGGRSVSSAVTTRSAGVPGVIGGPLAMMLAGLAAGDRREVCLLTERQEAPPAEPDAGSGAAATGRVGPPAQTIVRRRVEVDP